MVMPGDDGKFTVKLITPIAMSEKLNFAIREGGKTVGAGVVTKILNDHNSSILFTSIDNGARVDISIPTA